MKCLKRNETFTHYILCTQIQLNKGYYLVRYKRKTILIDQKSGVNNSIF